jgi:hypothetical protein
VIERVWKEEREGYRPKAANGPRTSKCESSLARGSRACDRRSEPRGERGGNGPVGGTGGNWRYGGGGGTRPENELARKKTWSEVALSPKAQRKGAWHLTSGVVCPGAQYSRLVPVRTSVASTNPVERKTPPGHGNTWGWGKGSTGKRGNPRVSI